MNDPSDATPEDPRPAPETDETIHPPDDGRDPDAPGGYVDDTEALDVPEPNEPA